MIIGNKEYILSDRPSNFYVNLAYQLQEIPRRGIIWVPQVLKTIIFKSTNYTTLRSKIHHWFETNRKTIRIIDIIYSRIEIQGYIKRTVEIIYEEKGGEIQDENRK